MIPRYSRAKMVAIWQEESRYNIWLKIQQYACEKQAELGVMPASVAKAIAEKGRVDSNRINEIEKTTKHDVIAFLTNLAESIGDEARYVHQGMTSSDVLDTCLAVQLDSSCAIIEEDLQNLLDAIEARAKQHKYTICMGRSHGIHAEPTTFGLKLATFHAEFARNLTRLREARRDVATCAISGAVGTFANINPQVEQYVAEKLGLSVETISTQVIPRDRHAMLFAVVGVIASSIERLATEIRHLQRTEVREVEEFFAKGQKGSSAMPHKRNPVLTENLTGLARYIRAATLPMMENVALWHERDISHSSVERMTVPDTLVALDFALYRLTGVVNNMVVYQDAMQANVDYMRGLIFSQRVLLELTQHGCSREQAYEIVQRNAMKVWQNQHTSLLAELQSDQEVGKFLQQETLRELFDMEYHTKNVDLIFNRVFC
jgi:adenylosuccinate lyase